MTLHHRLLTSLMVSAGLCASTAHAAATPKDPLSGANVISVFLGLVVVVALLLAAAWMIRRFQRIQAPREGALQVTAQLSLGLKERVILLRVGDENVLVGCTPGSIRPLHSWRGDTPAAAEPTVSAPSAPDFMSQLRGVLAAQGVRRPGASS